MRKFAGEMISSIRTNPENWRVERQRIINKELGIAVNLLDGRVTGPSHHDQDCLAPYKMSWTERRELRSAFDSHAIKMRWRNIYSGE